MHETEQTEREIVTVLGEESGALPAFRLCLGCKAFRLCGELHHAEGIGAPEGDGIPVLLPVPQQGR
jgi:hypothetical protein